MNHSQKIYTVVGATTIIALSGIVGFVLFTAKDTPSSRASTPTTSTTSSSPASSNTDIASAPASTSNSNYKDGTYTASANYNVPGDDTNNLNIKLTIADGKITAVTPTNDYQSRESQRYIDRFDSSISGTVVGQSLGDISVGRVGGASLTSSAFNDVLDTIRNEAKA